MIAILPTDLSDLHWLIVFAALPVAYAWLSGWVGRKPRATPDILIGNPLRDTPPPLEHAPLLKPLISLSRTEDSAPLMAYAQGLRHLPIQQTTPILRGLARQPDAEVQLYASNMEQLGRESLWEQLGHLEKRLHQPRPSARDRAALLETAYCLSQSFLLPASERATWLPRIRQWVELSLAEIDITPRLRAAAVPLLVILGEPTRALQELRALPEDSPLRTVYEPRVRFALRHTITPPEARVS